MKKGYRWFLLLLSGLCSLPLSAANVSFLVLETGLGENRGTNEYSALWENSLMDVFFEAGHIVSNAPIRRIAGEQVFSTALPPELQDDFDEAREGGSDFFILAHLNYRGTADEIPGIQAVSLRLFKVSSREFLAEQRYVRGTPPSSRDEIPGVRNTIQKLISHLEN